MELTIGILGIVIGVLASIWVGRYYYRRTVNKELSVFELLNSQVFAGIAPDVRHQLHFRFKNHDVTDLQQIMFLVANTGDRAIRDVIENVRLDLPQTASILDASIVHKQPSDLSAALRIAVPEPVPGAPAKGTAIHLEFPLLNTKEFFIVKMLLSGKLEDRPLAFHLLCDDLPRTICISRLPPSAYAKARYKFDWMLAIGSCAVISISVYVAQLVFRIAEKEPSLFPYPWATYKFSVESMILLVPAVFLCTVIGVVGIGMLAAAIFGGEFPPQKGPRFPLPKEIRDAVYPFPMWRFHPEFGETPKALDDDDEVAAESIGGPN